MPSHERDDSYRKSIDSMIRTNTTHQLVAVIRAATEATSDSTRHVSRWDADAESVVDVRWTMCHAVDVLRRDRPNGHHH